MDDPSDTNDISRRAIPPAGRQMDPPDEIVFILLAIFLGSLGVHRFYIGDKKRGLTLLLLTFPGIFLLFPPLISMVWSIVDACRVRLILADHAAGEFD